MTTRKRKPVTDEELISDFASGTTHQHITSVFAQSKNFVVFRVEGHKYWSSLYAPWNYAPVCHTLIHKGEYGIGGNRLEWEGRVTKAVKKEITEALNASEKAGRVVKSHEEKEKAR